MVYTNNLEKNKTHFIAIMPNYNLNEEKIGTQIHIKTFLPREISNKCYKFINLSQNQNLFNKYSNMSDVRFKNLIILSAKLNDTTGRPLTLITQQNINHNIKFIHKDNDFKQPRLLFMKYSLTNNIINDNQYLFNPINSITDLTNISILNNNNLNIDNTDTDINDINGTNFFNINNLDIYLNYFKPYKNSNYYGLKFNDFIDLSYITTNQVNNLLLNNINIGDLSLNKLNYVINNIKLFNNFENNLQYNYDINNFIKMFYSLDNIYNNNINSTTFNEISLNIDIPYVNDNIILYNTYDNISTINISFKYIINNIADIIPNGYKDISMNFCILKTYNYYLNKENYGKIFIGPNFTYMNTRIIDISNDFFNNNTYFKNKKDNGYIFLSLGNSISGITQADMFNHVKIDLSKTILSNVQYVKNYYNGIDKIYFYNSLTNTATNIMKSRNYLLNNNYNYNYDNILHINKITSNIKIVDLSINNYYYSLNNDFSYNIYKEKLNNLSILNNTINNQYFYENNYNSSNINFLIKNETDISYNSLDYKLKINNVFPFSDDALSLLYNNTLNVFKYDFRYNYSKSFLTDTYINYIYSYPTDLLNYTSLSQYTNKLLLNEYKINITSLFYAVEASDFTNVDCIYVYHDPYSINTPSEFRYPNNNIEITKDPNIDTFVKAIELLPGARTSTTNSTFIPAKNSSNLSRKMIQGLIGFNNVPALLSIEPYDENFITGRGFINQYQINNTCKTYTDKVITKLNSQKHISAKNNINSINYNYNINKPITKKQHFANIVRGKSKINITNNSNLIKECNLDPSTIKNYYTPFLMRKY